MSATIKTRERPRRRLTASAITFGRHQLSALVSTLLDFATMMLAREALGASVVQATMIGATVGGILNFELGRRWVFSARHGARGPQALRYAAVSAGAVVLNGLGMMVLESAFSRTPYWLLRVVVSFAVGVLWSYPAQGRLVFSSSPSRLS